VLDPASGWDSGATQIWFELQAPISPNAENQNYFLYYGDPGAANPPANGHAVFLFYDAFDGDGVDLSHWGIAGSPTVAGGYLTIPSGASVISAAGDAFGTDTRWDASLSLSIDQAIGLSYWSGSPDATFNDEYIRMYADGSGHGAANSDGGSPDTASIAVLSPTALHEYSFAREGGLSVGYEQDGVGLATISTSVPTTSLRLFMENLSSSQTMTYDWVRVRPYRVPEPIVNTGTEETSDPYCTVPTPMPSPTPTATRVPALWWQGEYDYRQAIRITGNTDTAVGAGETVRITLDTASLVAAGKMRADGNDLRIVYFNTLGENVELERQLFEMDSAGPTSVRARAASRLAWKRRLFRLLRKPE
jgi:hypothetical protein